MMLSRHDSIPWILSAAGEGWYGFAVELADGHGNVRGIQSRFFVQLFGRTMFNDGIGNAHHFYLCGIIMGSHEFQHGRTKTTYHGTVFNGDDLVEFGKHFM